MRDPRAIRTVHRAPLPQEEVGGAVTPVRIQSGFTQFLPARDLTFFQRVYFAPYPAAVQVGGGPPFPVPIPIAQIQAPLRQVIVLQQANFKVYQAVPIGLNNIVEVEPSRTATYFGFTLQLGNRGLTDYNSNINGRGAPVNFGGNAGTSLPPQPGSSSFYPFSGPAFPIQNFAAYARPSDLISAVAIVLQAPQYETRLFSVELGGYLLEEAHFDRILQRMGNAL